VSHYTLVTVQNSPARSGIDVGSVIADTYTLEALIGRGGMGAVFLASHKRLPGKKVAIKMLHAEHSGDEVLARFKREAEIASRLGHPNIVQVHDFNVLPDGTPYLVLELLEGETLAQRLRQGPIPLEQTLTIVRQIGSALAAAHREGIVHRDLKPQNIFLVPTEVQGRVVEIAKVLDFGISKIRGSQTVKTQDSALLGTPQYMAPEQALGQHANVDERTDVFALGAIVYEMLSGQPAFVGASIPEVVFKVVYEQPIAIDQAAPGLTPQIKSAIEGAMVKAAADRFPTVGAFVEALTGQPLSIIRAGSNSMPPADPGPGSGSRVRSTGKDAFAQTMGSGDHGASPISGVEATASVNSMVGGLAPTIDSQNQPPAVSVQPSAPPQRSRTLLVCGLFAGAAIAAVAMYFVMRSPGDKPPEPKTSTVAQILITSDAASAPPPSGAQNPTVEVPKPARAGEEAAPKPPVEAKEAVKVEPKKETKTDTKAATKIDTSTDSRKIAPSKQVDAAKPPPPAADGDSDETSAQKLRQAESLIESESLHAEQLANSVINGESSGPFQKLHAHAIRAVIMCKQHNDPERAMTDLRPILHSRQKGAAKLAKRVISECRSAGYLRDVQPQ
jgi:serine/threonine protein kinase